MRRRKPRPARPSYRIQRAQVMRDGVLVGFVPEIDGPDDWTEDQIIDAIVAVTTTSP